MAQSIPRKFGFWTRASSGSNEMKRTAAGTRRRTSIRSRYAGVSTEVPSQTPYVVTQQTLPTDQDALSIPGTDDHSPAPSYPRRHRRTWLARPHEIGLTSSSRKQVAVCANEEAPPENPDLALSFPSKRVVCHSCESYPHILEVPWPAVSRPYASHSNSYIRVRGSCIPRPDSRSHLSIQFPNRAPFHPFNKWFAILVALPKALGLAFEHPNMSENKGRPRSDSRSLFLAIMNTVPRRA
jgi:hypothetical protein